VTDKKKWEIKRKIITLSVIFLINPFIDAQLFSNSFQGSSCCCEKIEGRGQGYFCVLLNFYDQIF
jgi:hypothetical protein